MPAGRGPRVVCRSAFRPYREEGGTERPQLANFEVFALGRRRSGGTVWKSLRQRHFPIVVPRRSAPFHSCRKGGVGGLIFVFDRSVCWTGRRTVFAGCFCAFFSVGGKVISVAFFFEPAIVVEAFQDPMGEEFFCLGSFPGL